ncbi:unnamed protein product [Brachionus calyciflorus]|uniref:G-protein coupled receptors family 1 profile domain-containing protein n=1 Tax=Brachionus calyciflorus TaxID=104777 RepID=A0A813M4B5_9BILA|nr:unnamed protein product [Brachionus calyciflorus]
MNLRKFLLGLRIIIITRLVVSCHNLSKTCGFKSTLTDSKTYEFLNSTYKINKIRVDIINFIKFNDIDFRCINFEPNLIENLSLRPLYSITLDDNLKINHFSNLKIASKLLTSDVKFYFHSLNGIQVNSNFVFEPLLKIYKYRNIYIQFHDSLILTKGDCLSNNNKFGLFKNISTIYMAHTARYYSKTNPCLFQNSLIFKLIFYGLANNFIKTNIITFLGSLNSNLNSNISQLELNFFKGVLTKNLLDSHVFKELEVLTIDGILDQISSDALKNLTKIYLIILKMDEILKFFESGTSWMQPINSDIKINLENLDDNLLNFSARVVKLQFQSFEIFTDQVFCLFKNFPHSRLILPVFKKQQISNCSCTVLWLVGYNLYILDRKEYPIYEFCTYNKTYLKVLVKKCDFEKRLNLCSLPSREIRLVESQIGLLYLFELLDFIILCTYPIVFTLAISSNSINIIVLKKITTEIKKKTPKNSNLTIVFLMLMNSISNLTYVIIRLMHLMNKCVSQNSRFCSPISHTIFIQYFDVIVVNTLGNIIKFLSNFMLFLISLNRMFLLIGKKVLGDKTLAIISLILFITILLISSLEKIINPGINFVQENVYDLNAYVEYPDRNNFFINSGLAPKNLHLKTSRKVVSIIMYILYVLNYVLNDIVFLICFFMVEIFIIFKLKQNIKLKSKQTFIGDKKNTLKFIVKCNKTIKVILISSSIILMFKLFDFSVSTFISVKKLSNVPNNLCFKQSKICTILEEIDDYLFLISTSYSTILFFNLNMNFKKAIQRMICF